MTTPRLLVISAAAALGAAASADTVLVGTETGVLAYDTETGALAHLFDTPAPVEALTTIGRRGYYSTAQGVIRAVDLDTLDEVGAFAMSVDGIALASDGESLFAADTNGVIQRLDPETGALLEGVDTFSWGITSLGVHWGNLYYGSLNTVAERASLTGAFAHGAFELFAVCGGQIGSMTFAGIEVVLGSLNGSVYRYDEFNGSYADVQQIGLDSAGIATLVGGRQLVADSSGILREIDAETGATLREVDAGVGIGALHGIDIGAGCPADLDLSGVLDLGDIQTFVMLAIDARLGADLDGDSDVDLADVGLFVERFTGGCP